MAVPVAPAAGEPIAEAWGDVVHDAIVARDIQSGNSATPNAASGTGELSGTVTIVFPRPFAAPPQVVAMASNAHHYVALSSVTATQVVLISKRVGQTTGVGVALAWIAIGPRA
jgi:hypothetical protein